jgi:CheY-like chemotaxis protein
MQGNIWIESDLGKGSTFIFRVKAQIPESISLPEEKTAEADTAIADDFTGKKVLLVEDVEINREIVITVLEPLGLKVTEAEDGRRALNIFTAAPEDFDLIFMDIHMPGINGYETTELLRAIDHPRAKTVPIIAMTANVFKEDVERCLAADMNGHLGKPLDFDEVKAVLKKYLGKS